MVSTVHGPRPRSDASWPRASCQSLPALEVDPALGQGAGQAQHRAAPGPGHGQRLGIHVGHVGGLGKQVGQASPTVINGGTVGDDQPGGVGAGRGGGDLLADHGPEGELGRVDRAGDAPTGALVDQWGQHRITAQEIVDGNRVGIEIEQASAPVDGNGKIAEVGQLQLTGHVVGSRPEGDDAVAVGQAQGAAVRTVTPLLHPGHGGGGQVAEQVVGAQRLPEGQAQRQRTGRNGHAAGDPGAQLGG